MSYPTYMPIMQPMAQPQVLQQPVIRSQPMMQQSQPIMRPMYNMQSAEPVFVNGRAGADAYAMGPNEKVVLFDEKQPIFFFKATDGAGYPTTEEFEYNRKPAQGAAPAVAYATQEEVAALRAEISELKGVLNNGKQPVRKGTKADAAADE